MGYLLDANVFIQAKRLHYGFDFCPAFWDWLVHSHGKGNVASIEKVGGELTAGNDELATWATARGALFFLPPDQRVVGALTKISAWVTAQGYDPAAVSTFFQVADYYLVAHALAYGHTVVTHEKPDGAAKRVVKIPNVCIGLNVKCVTPFEMLRAEKARFTLGP